MSSSDRSGARQSVVVRSAAHRPAARSARPQSPVPAGRGHRPRRGRGQLHPAAGPDARRGRRVRLRQDRHRAVGPADHPAAGPDRRAARSSTTRRTARRSTWRSSTRAASASARSGARRSPTSSRSRWRRSARSTPIGHQMIERIRLHLKLGKDEARARAIETLARVGMPRPSQLIDRYAHQFSGGQRQRAIIAMALVCHPSLLIADEPTTALDVTTEAQILELLLELQKRLRHGDAVHHPQPRRRRRAGGRRGGDVPRQAGRVRPRSRQIFEDPRHPYTRALLRSIPKLGKKSHERLASIKGMVPDPYRDPGRLRLPPALPALPAGRLRRAGLHGGRAGALVLCNRAGDPWQ